MSRDKKKIFVAMSGGVDSSVAALLLKKEGYEAIGLTMCFGISLDKQRRPACCSLASIEDARRVAQQIDIAHHVLDFSKDIQRHVIDDFAEQYQRGRTPNPCVRCNTYIKFGSLYQRIRKLGGQYLATGHYARVEYSHQRQSYELKKAEDNRKDQSYFLYGIKKEILPFVLFPLGKMTKDQVRHYARQMGLKTAQKKASQDICFIPDSGYQQFLKDRLGESVQVPGAIKDRQGCVLGQHQGIAHYTIGQRDGLGIALGKPVYINRIDQSSNTIFVGDAGELLSNGLIAYHINLLDDKISKKAVQLSVRIRYNQKEIESSVEFLRQNKARVRFKEPQRAVAPGQSVVFYQDDRVLGGGVIEKPFRD